MTLIYAKFDEDLINISKITCCKTKWPHFLAYPVDIGYGVFLGKVATS